MDIRHFGTADALVDPTHDIAQNPLAIIVELGLYVVFGPVRPANRNGEEVGKLRRAAPSNYRLSSLVLGIVESVPFQMKMKGSAESSAGDSSATSVGLR